MKRPYSGRVLLVAALCCGSGMAHGALDLMFADNFESPGASFAVGGTVTGLVGSGLSLRLNGLEELSIDADGSFQFINHLRPGQEYSVLLAAQPFNPAQSCFVDGASGTVIDQAITTLSIQCSAVSGPVWDQMNWDQDQWN